MYSRWYNLTVIVFWLVAMGWLIGAKVLPPLRQGDPPNHRDVLDAKRREPLVGWRMAVDGRSFGWALNSVERREEGSTEIINQVHFNEFPLEQLNRMTLGLLSSQLGVSPRGLVNQPVNVETILIIDSFDRLFNFASTVCAPRLENSLRVQGTAEGQELELSIHFMDTEVPANIPLPAGAMLEDALSPQTQLPNLHAGQTWTVPVCSPLLPNSPVEILEARVEAAESIRWNGRRHDTWRVVYRKDPGAGLSSDRAAQGTLWVARDEDGTVLKQQADLMGATITFVRLGDEQAATLKEKIRQRQPFVRSQWPDKTPWESTEDDATTDDPFSENAGT